MIRVPFKKAPQHYIQKVKTPGDEFLTKHDLIAKGVPKNFRWQAHWKHIAEQLKENFSDRCGYCAMWIPGPGEVDHYISKTADPSRAYDWSNFRFADSTMNRRKAKHDGKILDPFKVKDDWFYIDIFTGKIHPSDSVPAHFKTKATDTIKLLRLNDRNYKKVRLKHIEDFEKNPSEEALLSLQKVSPLVASACLKHLMK